MSRKFIALTVSAIFTASGLTSLGIAAANANANSPQATRQWALTAESADSLPSYDAALAAGAPDATNCDGSGVWSPAGNNTVESITLSYENAVIPDVINVYQNNVQGAVSTIEVSVDKTAWTTVWSGLPEFATSGTCRAENQYNDVLSAAVTGITVPISYVRVTVDTSQSQVNNYAEIDAVELVSGSSWTTDDWSADGDIPVNGFVWGGIPDSKSGNVYLIREAGLDLNADGDLDGHDYNQADPEYADMWDSIGKFEFYLESTDTWYTIRCTEPPFAPVSNVGILGGGGPGIELAGDGSGDIILKCDTTEFEGVEGVIATVAARFYAEGDMVRMTATLSNDLNTPISYDWRASGAYGEGIAQDFVDGRGWEITKNGVDHPTYATEEKKLTSVAWGLPGSDGFPAYQQEREDEYFVVGQGEGPPTSLAAGASATVAIFAAHNMQSNELNSLQSYTNWVTNEFSSFSGRLVSGLENANVVNWEPVATIPESVTSVVGGSTNGSLVTSWDLQEVPTGGYLAFAKADEFNIKAGELIIMDTTCFFDDYDNAFHNNGNAAKVGYKNLIGLTSPLELNAYDGWYSMPGTDDAQFEPGALYSVCLFDPSNNGVGQMVTGRASLLDDAAPVPTIANGYRADKLGNVYFAPGSSKLSNAAKNKLKSLVTANPASIYKVTGYVQKARSSKNDAALSLARAKAVETYLASIGAGVNFTVVTDAGLVPVSAGKSDKARKATLFAMTPVVK